MDPESLGDFELKMEEGIPIGPMASDPGVDASRNEAAMMLFNKPLNQLTEIELIKLDEFLASQATGPQQGVMDENITVEEVNKVLDEIKLASGPADKYEAQIQKLMQEMNISRELAEALILGSDPASVDFLKNLRKGGIAGLRQGGRIGYSEGSWEAEWDRLYNDYKAKQIELGKEFVSKEEFIDMHRDNNAQGGRVQRYGGGVMDLGGIEKDYRTTGGFVDIGGRERADDVPARLSRNEFVMTADAVRAAGGGSINKGAQRMYNVMKHLETKGAAA